MHFSPSSSTVPSVGNSDVTAFVPRFAISNAIASELTATERARGVLEAATLSDESVRR
jgi:hypothetical protein